MDEPPSATVDDPKIAPLYDNWMREIQKYMKFVWLPSVDMIGTSEDYTRCVIATLERRLEWGRKNDNQLVVDDANDKIKKVRVHLKTLEELNQHLRSDQTLQVCMGSPYG